MNPSPASRSSPAEESIASAIVLTVVKSFVATFSKAIAFAVPSFSVEKGLKLLISIAVSSKPKISSALALLIPDLTNEVSGVITVAEVSAIIMIFSTSEPEIISTV